MRPPSPAELLRQHQRLQAWRQLGSGDGQSFPEQDAYVRDAAKLVTALCSRRAGKSHGNGRRILRAAHRFPDEMSLYVSMTKNNSRMVLGRALMQLSRKHELGLILKEVDGRLMCIAPNGHHAWLAGAKNRVDFEQFRGYKFAEVIIDEAQLYPWLQDVVEEIIEPCVGDLDGAIALSGTPAPLPVGYFHAVTTGDDYDNEGTPILKWSTHTWTVAENVFFRNGRGAEWREQIKARRNWTDDHPRLQREYYGRWSRDDDALVYPFDGMALGDGTPGRNVFHNLPPGDWIYGLGIDLGGATNTPGHGITAFVLAAYRRGHPEVYIIKAQSWQNLIPSRIAAKVLEWKRDHPIGQIVVDEGGLGSGYAEEWRQSFGIGCEPAEKKRKRGFIELVQGDLLAGVIKVHPVDARELIDEWGMLPWNEDHTDHDKAAFPDHLSDAALYITRALRPWYNPEEVEPEFGTRQYLEREEARHKARLVKEIRERQRKQWQRQLRR